MIKKLSVIIPIYNEEANIPTLFPRLMPVLEGLGREYELLLSDDGSRDRSAEMIKEQIKRYPTTIRLMELARNFGQHPAILAAFQQVTGDAVITLDADLQNPPEEIPKLLAKLDEGYDVVGGIRQQRQDTLFRRAASKIVNKLTTLITGMKLQDYGCMLRGYSREVVNAINMCEENSTFIPALGLLFARKPIEIPVAHARRARRAGTKYSVLPADPPQFRFDDRVFPSYRCNCSRCSASLSRAADCCSGLFFHAVRRFVWLTRVRGSGRRVHIVRARICRDGRTDGRARDRRRIHRPHLSGSAWAPTVSHPKNLRRHGTTSQTI